MTPDLTALWRVWNKTYDLFCPPQLSSHTTSSEQTSDGSWGALRSLRIAPVTSTAFLSATASCHSPAITGSLSEEPFRGARVSWAITKVLGLVSAWSAAHCCIVSSLLLLCFFLAAWSSGVMSPLASWTSHRTHLSQRSLFGLWNKMLVSVFEISLYTYSETTSSFTHHSLYSLYSLQILKS